MEKQTLRIGITGDVEVSSVGVDICASLYKTLQERQYKSPFPLQIWPCQAVYRFALQTHTKYALIPALRLKNEFANTSVQRPLHNIVYICRTSEHILTELIIHLWVPQ